MAVARFACIVFKPPPDCPRCSRPVVLPGTPDQFRPANARTACGARDLCQGCYSTLKRCRRDELARYPAPRKSSARTKVGLDFVNIVIAPPPDCRHCARPTYWRKTPQRFRPADARAYCGVRELCTPCYRYLLDTDRELLADYPRKYRSSWDVVEEFNFLRSHYSPDTVTNREIAQMMNMSDTAVYQARYRFERRNRALTEGAAA